VRIRTALLDEFLADVRATIASPASAISGESASGNTRFDVLFYPEVGMFSHTLWLANQRLARVQVAGYGHSVSTFGAKIDYWIGGADAELPPDDTAAAASSADGALETLENAFPELEPLRDERTDALRLPNYSETLVLLPGLGCEHDRPSWTTDDTRLQSWTSLLHAQRAQLQLVMQSAQLGLPLDLPPSASLPGLDVLLSAESMALQQLQLVGDSATIVSAEAAESLWHLLPASLISPSLAAPFRFDTLDEPAAVALGDALERGFAPELHPARRYFVINCAWSTPKINLPHIARLRAVLQHVAERGDGSGGGASAALAPHVIFRFFLNSVAVSEFVAFQLLCAQLGCAHIQVAAPVQAQRYLRLFARGHVFVDSSHHGACNTLVDALVTHTPVILLEGKRWNNRIGPATLRRLGLGEWVVPAARQAEFARQIAALAWNATEYWRRVHLLSTLDLSPAFSPYDSKHFPGALRYLHEEHDRIQHGVNGPPAWLRLG
jgi:hypothetical protein